MSSIFGSSMLLVAAGLLSLSGCQADQVDPMVATPWFQVTRDVDRNHTEVLSIKEEGSFSGHTVADQGVRGKLSAAEIDDLQRLRKPALLNIYESEELPEVDSASDETYPSYFISAGDQTPPRYGTLLDVHLGAEVLQAETRELLDTLNALLRRYAHSEVRLPAAGDAGTAMEGTPDANMSRDE